MIIAMSFDRRQATDRGISVALKLWSRLYGTIQLGSAIIEDGQVILPEAFSNTDGGSERLKEKVLKVVNEHDNFQGFSLDDEDDFAPQMKSARVEQCITCSELFAYNGNGEPTVLLLGQKTVGYEIWQTDEGPEGEELGGFATYCVGCKPDYVPPNPKDRW